jgi:hypothetical protein
VPKIYEACIDRHLSTLIANACESGKSMQRLASLVDALQRWAHVVGGLVGAVYDCPPDARFEFRIERNRLIFDGDQVVLDNLCRRGVAIAVEWDDEEEDRLIDNIHTNNPKE